MTDEAKMHTKWTKCGIVKTSNMYLNKLVNIWR